MPLRQQNTSPNTPQKPSTSTGRQHHVNIWFIQLTTLWQITVLDKWFHTAPFVQRPCPLDKNTAPHRFKDKQWTVLWRNFGNILSERMNVKLVTTNSSILPSKEEELKLKETHEKFRQQLTVPRRYCPLQSLTAAASNVNILSIEYFLVSRRC